jgi:hypothetical protein
MAQLLDRRIEVRYRLEAHGALSELAVSDDFGLELSLAELQALSGEHFPSRPYQSLPLPRGKLLHEKHLHAAGDAVVGLGVQARAMGEEPRRDDARVVEDQKIAGLEQLRQVTEPPIQPGAG